MNELKKINISRGHFKGISKNEYGVTSNRTLISQFVGKKGCSLVRSQEEELEHLLLINLKPNIVFTGANFHLALM